MNKRSLVLLAVTIIVSLAAFGFKNLKNADTDLDLVYKVDSRFQATITKEDLHNATSVLDIVPEDATHWWRADFETVKVAILEDSGETSFNGTSGMLNLAQIGLLRTANYSTNFYISAQGKTNQRESGRIVDYAYYFTVIPEHEAEYKEGQAALIDYLKEGSKEQTIDIRQDKLRPGQFSFTVTKEGTISNVTLLSSSGYSTVDQKLVDLIQNMPQKWQSATNIKGEKVEQELIFFFGLEGC